MATALTLAGAPTPSVPLAADDVARPIADRGAAPADALVVEAVRRVTHDGPRNGGVVAKS